MPLGYIYIRCKCFVRFGANTLGDGFLGNQVIYEVMQYVLAIGRSDITDVIMNTTGGIVGILGYSLLRKICRNERRAEIVVLVCAVFGSAAVSGFLLAVFYAN